MKKDVKLNNARYRNKKLIENKKAKAEHNLVRWDEFRIKKAEIVQLY